VVDIPLGLDITAEERIVVAPAVWPRLTPQQLGERTGQGQDRMDQSGRDLA